MHIEKIGDRGGPAGRHKSDVEGRFLSCWCKRCTRFQSFSCACVASAEAACCEAMRLTAEVAPPRSIMWTVFIIAKVGRPMAVV